MPSSTIKARYDCITSDITASDCTNAAYSHATNSIKEDSCSEEYAEFLFTVRDLMLAGF